MRVKSPIPETLRHQERTITIHNMLTFQCDIRIPYGVPNRDRPTGHALQSRLAHPLRLKPAQTP